MINPFLGKRVTAISVFEPWLEPGLVPKLPLFGAIAFEFEDVALFCRSPLRYQFGNPKHVPKHAPSKSCLPIRCDLEQLEWHKGLLSELGMARRLPGWIAIRPTGIEVAYPTLANLLGAEFASYGFLSRQIFELCFVGQESMLATYREDLDGALQLARIGFREVVVHGPEHAFGWLHDQAPYPIHADGRHWPDSDAFIREKLWLAGRRGGSPSAAVTDRIRQRAWRLKANQYPHLAVRFRAICYPVRID